MNYYIEEKALEALARGLYPYILASFEDEKTQREFEEWKRNKAGKGEEHEPNDTD